MALLGAVKSEKFEVKAGLRFGCEDTCGWLPKVAALAEEEATGPAPQTSTLIINGRFQAQGQLKIRTPPQNPSIGRLLPQNR
jgi:hypothetical protein